MSTAPSPQLGFDKARFAGEPPSADSCSFCQRELTGEYFRVADRLACAVCAKNAAAMNPSDNHKAFSQALLYGAGAAAAGCAGYAVFGILTGITIGWAAVAVGWMVGKAMRKGSRGLGGRRYQIAAAALTYAAVAVAFVPMAMHELSGAKEGRARQSTEQRTEARQAAGAEQSASRDTGRTPGSGPGFFVSLAMLLGIGLISPFLLFTASIGSALLNLFILFLGMRTAWRLAAGVTVLVEGPYGG